MDVETSSTTFNAYVANYCQTVAEVKHPFEMFVKN